ncbi:MAG: prepilin-type N-terminal cleavage/methylation domain-containing protein [Candidatus Omnitrophica bacterium]|nr:prepilin-type N-terminal cleavage/methylation domain-containing protein [Candidatus Omnitrophota bacterium]
MKYKKKFLRVFRLRPKKAFTLVEVMVAVAVIVILVSAVAYSFITISQIRAQSHHMSIASLWAQDKLEEYKVSAYGSVADGSDTDGVYMKSWSSGGYVGSSSVITVTITYPSNSAAMNSVTLTTIKADK